MTIPRIDRFASRFYSVLSSQKTFYIFIALFVLQAVWLAIVARYPMAFDENFHLGIIQIYSHQWSPFITSTPPDSGAYGELIRTTSYLYQYLMSFPYRLITTVTGDQTLQIILLRFINITLFTGGLILFKKFLLRLRFPTITAHLALLILTLIPVVPFLAGQVNYDNLIMLILPIAGLLALDCSQALAKNGRLPITRFILLLCLGMLGSLVKYAFSPVFFAIALYLMVIIIKQHRFTQILKNSWQAFAHLKPLAKYMLVTLLVVTGGLFIERYGVNIISYGSIEPDCANVESVEHCKQYGPWGRNYDIEQENQAAGTTESPSIPAFLPMWIYGMMHRLYFAINYNYTNYFELPLPTIVAYLAGVVGLVVTGIYGRRLVQGRPELLLPIFITTIYVASVIYVNLGDYLHYKAMLAINGRYLIPILPLVFAFMISAYGLFTKRLTRNAPAKRLRLNAILVTIVLVFTLNGGGVLTFAVRSDSSWYWENPVAQTLGNGLRRLVTPFIIGADSRTQSYY